MSDVDSLVESIVDAGPDGSRTVVPQAQASALVRRDVLEHSRQGTAEALDVSVWTLDDRLARARDNSRSAVAVVRQLLEAGAVPDEADDDDLEAIRDLLEDDQDDQDDGDVVESDQDDETDDTSLSEDVLEEITAAVERDLERDDEPDQDDEEIVDDEAAAWGRIMTLETVRDVTRSNGAVSVELEGADTDDRQVVGDALRGLGYDLYDHSDLSGSLEVVRGRLEDGDEEALSDVESEADDQDDEEPVDDQDADETETYACDGCGETFESPGALGGHSRYCDERED